MNSKRIAIIGANESIVPLIKKAKALGFETHVFAWRCGDPGEREADFFYPISVSDKERILEECKKIGVHGVCSITSDFAAPVVAFLSRKLGLPGNPEITDLVARNKYEMRRAFQSTGLLYSPRFVEISDLNHLNDLVDGFKFPLIVKPVDRWSSKGISRVDSFNDLESAVKIAINESLSKTAIVEEFVDGPEYSAECIVYNGEASILTFTKKTTTGYPHYIETGHMQPSDIPINSQQLIICKIKAALKALGIYNSAAHAEFRIMENGDICFMEIGARMGGDYIGTDLTPISTGMDYLKMVIDVACGNKPCFDKLATPKKVCVRFILEKKDLDFCNSISDERIIRKNVFDVDFDRPVTDSSSRHGYFIYELEN